MLLAPISNHICLESSGSELSKTKEKIESKDIGKLQFTGDTLFLELYIITENDCPTVIKI